MGLPFVDITGQRFNMLRVESLIDKTFCVVVCDCGTKKTARINNIKRGHTRSCGCLGKDNNLTHGVARNHPEIYTAWGNMMGRCYRANTKHYANYGGRGIRVCDRWHDAGEFCKDMLPSWKKGLTLERKDSNGNYGPENCRWATRQEQQNNLRTNRRIDTPAGEMTISQAARHYGLTHALISKRLKLGWDETKAVLTPKRLPKMDEDTPDDRSL